MRRTAKENKFFNQKDKINEMILKEEINYVNKYANHFNLNQDESYLFYFLFFRIKSYFF